MAPWHGYYLDGRTAARHLVTLQPLRQALQITTSTGQTFLWPYGQIRQTQGAYSGEQVRLELGGEYPEVVLVADEAFLTTLHEVAPDLTTHFHHPVRRGHRVRLTILAAIGVVAGGALVYLYGIPWLAGVLAQRVPVAWEEQLGRTVVDRLVPESERCTNPTRSASMDALVHTLSTVPPQGPYTFHVLVANRPMVNAFAAPGGYIVVFRGLLDLTHSPEELAGVLAHEMQHVLSRHATRTILEHASTALLVTALSGDVSGTLALGAEAAQTLGSLRYSRRHETEADRGGMNRILAAGIDPEGMIRFFHTLAKQGPAMPQSLSYLSTHPSTEDRLQRLQALAADAAPPQHKLLPDSAWDDIKRMCQRRTPIPGPPATAGEPARGPE